ncbi:MAG: hypothetical protein KJO31_10890 [Gammaproteobacteria bacterium]|nr:hypothetical protein [Gammaproteobacteria bacterium]
MNCFPVLARVAVASRALACDLARGLIRVIFLGLLIGCAAAAAQPKGSATTKKSVYDIEYRVRPLPAVGEAQVELRLRQKGGLLREVNMRAPVDWISQVSGDGQLTLSDQRVLWRPPQDGGVLRWTANIINERSGNGFDSFMDLDWALFRADDIIPSATTRTLKGARSATTLSFDLPNGWSSVTQYFGTNDRYAIRNRERRFDRPTGWVVLGRIGVRNEEIAGVRVKIAGPVGHDIRRMDMIALLRWTLPEVARVFPGFPARVTVVSAGDPMWRGGLSAPASLFLHAGRPMISENGTSTLLHELVHIGFGKKAAAGADWIVEGLAELYSLEALKRSGTISHPRFLTALEKLEQRGKNAGDLCGASSSGATTAQAVTVLHELDLELRQNGASGASLDDVVQQLSDEAGKVSVASLRRAAEKALGGPSRVLDAELTGNCG